MVCQQFVSSDLGCRTASAQVEAKENKEEPKNKILHGVTSEYRIQNTEYRFQSSGLGSQILNQSSHSCVLNSEFRILNSEFRFQFCSAGRFVPFPYRCLIFLT